ncbi:MAG: AbrB/MazE/SpoVT family DNA-binding domain-containing protein [Ignavibacteriae bacterium]|nr:AbrB/MazE/SpoVT family DNA-binding domain-containing protein [Ignavibacteriota bacterium]MCB9248572.1 AbrB/MazE/SpoVT family DNA-binding domain-containing protein [Ignavibacteriales bacterium]
MITKVIKIGNSRGIRIPKTMIDQSGITDKVEIETKENKIIIKGIPQKRKNWEAAFEKMAQNNDDILLDKESLDNQNSWDEEEWTW